MKNSAEFDFLKLHEDILERIRTDPINFLGLQDILEEDRRKKDRKPRTTRRKTDRQWFWSHGWGRLLKDPEIHVENSYQWKQFQSQFRMPPPLFFEFLNLCKSKGILIMERESKIPYEIKILIALRILARDNLMHDVALFVNVGVPTVHSIFHRFIKDVTEKLFPLVVTMPEGKHLKDTLEMYEKLGFPGCCGSVDCTHIAWDRCPDESYNFMKGKEGFPTVSFEVIVDHTRRVLSVSEAFDGSTNDMTIAASDELGIRPYST